MNTSARIDRSVHPKAYIIILNWNGWPDTVECLESVFRNRYANYQVIVCDNGSTDDSWPQLQAWAEGQLAIPAPGNPALRSLTVPPVSKPIEYLAYGRVEAEAGGDARVDGVPLILIQTGANLGFSGGNNVAFRFALERDDFAYAWVLNNDTIITPNALHALVSRVEEKPGTGVCGSTLLYYHAPEIVQARGGAAHNRWFATMRPLGQGQSVHAEFDHRRIERSMKYPTGASMLVTRDFLKTVGLLSENYFLYCEELDWVTRAGDRFSLAYSPESVVYHKEGRSVRAAGDQRFHFGDYYLHRNRLRYTRRFFPIALPTAVLRTLAAALVRLLRGQPRRAWSILRLIFSRQTYSQADVKPPCREPS